MEYLIGVGLGIAVCVFAAAVGFDRERVFYPTLVPVVATYYILFAVMGNSMLALGWECLVAGAFFVSAVVGFKKNLWLIAAALIGHGAFDFFHHLLIHNPRGSVVVARLLPFLRHFGWSFSRYAADATPQLRFEGRIPPRREIGNRDFDCFAN